MEYFWKRNVAHVIVRHLENHSAKGVLGLCTRLPRFRVQPIREQRANLEVLKEKKFIATLTKQRVVVNGWNCNVLSKENVREADLLLGEIL